MKRPPASPRMIPRPASSAHARSASVHLDPRATALARAAARALAPGERQCQWRGGRPANAGAPFWAASAAAVRHHPRRMSRGRGVQKKKTERMPGGFSNRNQAHRLEVRDARRARSRRLLRGTGQSEAVTAADNPPAIAGRTWHRRGGPVSCGARCGPGLDAPRLPSDHGSGAAKGWRSRGGGGKKVAPQGRSRRVSSGLRLAPCGPRPPPSPPPCAHRQLQAGRTHSPLRLASGSAATWQWSGVTYRYRDRGNDGGASASVCIPPCPFRQRHPATAPALGRTWPPPRPWLPSLSISLARGLPPISPPRPCPVSSRRSAGRVGSPAPSGAVSRQRRRRRAAAVADPVSPLASSSKRLLVTRPRPPPPPHPTAG